MQARDVVAIESVDDIAACWPAFSILRPALDFGRYAAQVQRQRQQGYRIIATPADGRMVSVAGFRCLEYLFSGKTLYIDDLSTLAEYRGRGYASALLDWIFAHAAALDCDAVHLDSGHTRHSAHRLYLDKGFRITSHHFSKSLRADPGS